MTGTHAGFIYNFYSINTMKRTKINWYELKEGIHLYIDGRIFKKIIEKGIKKSGSLSKLCIELNSNHFYRILKEEINGTSIKRLKMLLDFLNIKYDKINHKILEIRKGKKISIKNPKFPINLLDESMGSIIGHMVSDGSLYYDKSRKDFIRTKYNSPDKTSINFFLENIKNVFGEVHYNESFIRNCNTIRFGNSIIGECLRKSGMSVGKKFKLDKGIPWIIYEGNLNMKRNYLSSVFDDEGSVGVNPLPYVILSRSIHMNLDKKEEQFVEKWVKPHMKVNKFPTGYINYNIPTGKLKDILQRRNKNLYNKILSSKPKILIDESKLLNEFNVENSIYTISFNITNNGGYSISNSLVIRKKRDITAFFNNIGFNLYRKQERLRNRLEEVGWINGNTALQHINTEERNFQIY